MVALLVPRVGEEDVDRGERRRRDHRLEHLDRVVLDDPHVLEPPLVDPLQQCTDAGRVDLDADEVDVRRGRGDLGRRAAHAEADLDRERRGAAEDAGEVDRRRGEGNDEARCQRRQRACLARPHSAGADDEAADALDRLNHGDLAAGA